MRVEELEEVYRGYADMIYRFLLAQTADASLAEELTQETFYQAVRSVNRYDGSCKVGTWLCGIAKNVLRRERRRRSSVPLEEDGAALPGPEEAVLGEMGRMALLRRLHALPEPMREVVYLRMSADLSFREIGEIVGRTENWARVTYFRAKEKLIATEGSNGTEL